MMKKCSKLLTLFHIFDLTFLLGMMVIVAVEGAEEYPTVGLLKWMSSEGFEWEYENLTSELITVKEFERETSYTVAPSLFAISVTCNASYPVQWIFKHYDRMKMYNVRVRSYRITENIYDVKSFKFASILVIYSDSNSVTGAYSCQKIDSEKIQNNIYIYWLGGSPPYLLQAGKTLTVKSEDGETLIFPCQVSSPEVSDKVILYQQNGTGDYIPQSVGQGSIEWDPRIGYRLHLKNVPSPYGHYKCEMSEGGENEDFVYLVAVQGLDTKMRNSHNNNILRGNATFGYDKDSRRIKCCSTTAKRPVMTKIYCSDPLSCKLREFAVFQGGNNGAKSGNGSCTLGRKFYRESGVIRCKGDGIDVVRHFFSPIIRNDTDGPGIYFNWAEADVSKLIEIRTTVRSSPYAYSSQSTGKIYSNQSFYIICDACNYYFAQGLHFALKWRNQTVQYLNDTSASQGFYFGFDVRRHFQLVAHIDMVEAICWAPVWNSTAWVKKTYSLNITQSIPPLILTSTMKDVKWSLGQLNRTIQCVTKVGQPIADVHWTRNERIILNDSNTGVSFGNGSVTLIFKKVSLDIHGEYKCVAKNVAGLVKETVLVTVVHDIKSSSSWGVLGISLMVLLSLALAGGIGVLIWRMKLQKRIIDHMSGIMFRDLSDSPRTPSQNSVHQVLE